jgi:hypothetical protein
MKYVENSANTGPGLIFASCYQTSSIDIWNSIAIGLSKKVSDWELSDFDSRNVQFHPTVELLHFSHFHHVSLVQWTNRLLPATGAQFSSSRPGDATHTLELGLPGSDLSLQLWPPTWSLFTGYDRSSLHMVFAATCWLYLWDMNIQWQNP